MACRVVRDENNNVLEVYASNGNISNLWTQLSEATDDKNLAYERYLISRTDKFRESLSDMVDENGEPLIGEVNLAFKDFCFSEGIHMDPKAKEKLISKMENFLEQIGVSYNSVKEIRDRKGNILDAISWLSFGCDGNNSLFDIQEMSNLPIDDLIYSLNILQKNKLIL